MFTTMHRFTNASHRISFFEKQKYFRSIWIVRPVLFFKHRHSICANILFRIFVMLDMRTILANSKNTEKNTENPHELFSCVKWSEERKKWVRWRWPSSTNTVQNNILENRFEAICCFWNETDQRPTTIIRFLLTDAQTIRCEMKGFNQHSFAMISQPMNGV